MQSEFDDKLFKFLVVTADGIMYVPIYSNDMKSNQDRFEVYVSFISEKVCVKHRNHASSPADVDLAGDQCPHRVNLLHDIGNCW